jgi:hypothetical protein
MTRFGAIWRTHDALYRLRYRIGFPTLVETEASVAESKPAGSTKTNRRFKNESSKEFSKGETGPTL